MGRLAVLVISRPARIVVMVRHVSTRFWASATPVLGRIECWRGRSGGDNSTARGAVGDGGTRRARREIRLVVGLDGW
jgi:hypothetical protein